MLYPVLHTVERVAYSVLYCVREIDVFGIAVVGYSCRFAGST